MLAFGTTFKPFRVKGANQNLSTIFHRTKNIRTDGPTIKVALPFPWNRARLHHKHGCSRCDGRITYETIEAGRSIHFSLNLSSNVYLFTSVSPWFRDGVSQYRGILLGYDYAEKADLGKWYWNPKRKLGVTTYFSEKIKQQ